MSLVGKTAPDVTLDLHRPGHAPRSVELSSLRGRWVVLFFYPMAFTSVCGSEVVAFREHHDQFEKLDAVVIGGSTDSAPTQMAWMNHELGELPYAMFSDMRRDVARSFDVLREDLGTANRATFIIDPEGRVVWEVVHELHVGRSTEEVLRVLRGLQSGEACMADERPGVK